MHLETWSGFLKTNWNKQSRFKLLWNLLDIWISQISSLLLFSVQSLFLWLYSGSYEKYCKLTVRAFHEQCDLITSWLSTPFFQLRKASLFRTTLKLLKDEDGRSCANCMRWVTSQLRASAARRLHGLAMPADVPQPSRRGGSCCACRRQGGPTQAAATSAAQADRTPGPSVRQGRCYQGPCTGESIPDRQLREAVSR